MLALYWLFMILYCHEVMIMKYNIRFLEPSRRNNAHFPFYIYQLKCEEGSTVINAHWHEEVEILYTTCSGIIEIDKERTHFNKDSIIFINKEQLHLVKAHSNGQIYALVFNFELLEFKNNDTCQNDIIKKLENKFFLFPNFIESKNNLQKENMNIIFDIISLYYSDTLGRELKIKSNLYDLIFLFYTNNLFVHSNNKYHNAAQLAYVKKMITFMENNYTRHISIDDFEKNCNVSKFYLIKLFKQISGETPIIYLRNLRIDISKDILAQGFSVTETAFMSGFNNVSYYIRQFKEKNGISPKEYQRNIELR